MNLYGDNKTVNLFYNREKRVLSFNSSAYLYVQQLYLLCWLAVLNVKQGCCCKKILLCSLTVWRKRIFTKLEKRYFLGNLKRVVNFWSSLFLYQLKNIITIPLEMGLNSRYFHKKVLNVIRIYKLLLFYMVVLRTEITFLINFFSENKLFDFINIS